MRQPDATSFLLNAQRPRVCHAQQRRPNARQRGPRTCPVHRPVGGDNSSTLKPKLSYDRSSNALTFKRLKNTSLPKFFTDLGHDNTTLPAYDLSQMSVQRYLALARTCKATICCTQKTYFPLQMRTMMAGRSNLPQHADKRDAFDRCQLAGSAPSSLNEPHCNWQHPNKRNALVRCHLGRFRRNHQYYLSAQPQSHLAKRRGITANRRDSLAKQRWWQAIRLI